MDQQIPDARIIDWAGQRCRHDLLLLTISGEFLGQGGIILGLLYLHRKEASLDSLGLRVKAPPSIVKGVTVVKTPASKSVVHRDLKTDNLLGWGPGRRTGETSPSAGGCVKIADFGISKRLSGASLARRSHHASISAEPSEYGPESDLWSLGVVLYELALLRAPFGLQEDGQPAPVRQQRLIEQICKEKPLPLPFSRAAVLHKVVIGGLLQKQPSQRPSAAELCKDPDLGAAIHRFLEKNKLLDHPSILEVLDVLPNKDKEGTYLASDLEVLTLKSHRSSLNGTGGSFLDRARLSESELRSLLGEEWTEVFESAGNQSSAGRGQMRICRRQTPSIGVGGMNSGR
ncbi:unnamed protein product [Effrenium voratum]|nr:unnamed protein product [Effrenium voratum]